MSRGKMLKKKHIFVIKLMLLFILVVWTIWGNVTVGITRYTVTSNRLPHSFDGYKIAVVSDLHNAQFGNNNSQLVEKIKKEHPDIIAITGDLVDSNRTDIEIAIQLVSRLTEIAPCYYVTGNHEAWINEQYKELEKGLIAENVVILHDNVIQLTKGSETIQIAGQDDPYFTNTDTYIQESMLQTRINNMSLSNEYCILLSHRPEMFEAYVSEEFDLVLSGHAHGGQFRVPFIGGIIAPDQGLFPEFDAGKYSKNNTIMIVSRGIGNSIIPVRFNNRPEIVIVELISE